MKITLTLTVLGLLLAGLPAMAQTAPPNNWDISKFDVSKLPAASDQKDVAFDKDILPLFKASCVRCHGVQRPRGGLRLDGLDAVLKGGHDGKMVIPGDSKNSLLVVAAACIDDRIAMPPKRRPRGGPGVHATDSSTNAAPHSSTNAPAGGPTRPPAKPLTAEEVGLVRAWIDQGAK